MSAPTPDRIVKIGYAYREAKALLSAVELGVFTALSGQALDAEQLRARIGIERRAARDFFDALVALELLDRDDAGRYSNTAESACYLDRTKATYHGGELEFINAQLYGRWNDLTAALRTGQPQAGAAGGYEARYRNPAARQAFARAMTVATLPVAAALASKFPWRDHKSVADVGSAQGCLLVEIVEAHQHLTGCGFDLPPLEPLFDDFVKERGLSGRLRYQPGDFFQDPLPAADVLIMGRVLHNWDLAGKRMLLRKAYEALPNGGALIVYERLIDDARRTNAKALLSSLNMAVMTAGGFDFTAADCIGWMQDAGFGACRAEPLTGDQTMIVGTK